MLFEICALLLCLFYLYHAFQLPFGTLAETGPGFFPIMLGLLGSLVAAVLLVQSALETRQLPLVGRLLHGRTIDLAGNRDLLLFILSTVVFIMVFEFLGGIIAILLLVVVLSKICGLRGWLKPTLLGVITTACLYVVFAMAFRINLPSGILPFNF